MTRTLEIYTQGLHLAERIFDQVKRNENLIFAEVRDYANLLMQNTLQSPDDFLQYSIRSTPNNFLLAHSVNCVILTSLIGQDLGYESEKLEILAVATLLHDIGMVKMFDLVNSPVKFSKKEREELEKHSVHGAEIIDQLQDIDSSVRDAILQHHEDDDGMGYPSHLKEKGINELASVIHVADVYEALSHPRPYRNAMLPHAAIKETVDSKQRFNRRPLKTLLTVVSLFPLGTYVQLNTKAIGKVVKVTKTAFMRPTLQILVNHDGRPAPDGMLIELV
ncbi:MAG: HD domain-containing protein [Candidatus Omnitrophica bacterium]|nr:HD domain-containing protein [Candidatus Omnitrophota bacterium]